MAHSVYIVTVTDLLQAAQQLGANKLPLLRGAGIAPLTLSQKEGRIPLDKFLRLYRLSAEATHNPDIALCVGRVSYLTGLNTQLYMGTVCKHFRDYLNLMPSLLKLRGDLGEVVAKKDADLIRLEWQPLFAETSRERYLSDEMLSASTHIINNLCVLPIPIVKAHFSYPKPDDTSSLQKLFGNDLYFNQAVSGISFARSALDYLMVQQSEETLDSSQSTFSDLVNNDALPDEFFTVLRRLIIRLLPEGEMNIDTVASELHVSKRTLQRRLSQRNTQFQFVLQNIRAEYALRYLADKRLTVTEIAFLLGYADQASFSHAFRTWHGVSPSEYRR